MSIKMITHVYLIKMFLLCLHHFLQKEVTMDLEIIILQEMLVLQEDKDLILQL